METDFALYLCWIARCSICGAEYRDKSMLAPSEAIVPNEKAVVEERLAGRGWSRIGLGTGRGIELASGGLVCPGCRIQRSNGIRPEPRPVLPVDDQSEYLRNPTHSPARRDN